MDSQKILFRRNNCNYLILNALLQEVIYVFFRLQQYKVGEFH